VKILWQLFAYSFLLLLSSFIPMNVYATPETSNLGSGVKHSTQVVSQQTEQALSEVVILLVDKNKLEARLKTWPENFDQAKDLSKYTIAVGKELGDKEKEGDNRTPEGIYFTKSLILDFDLPKKYGPRAIPINFPNPVDRKDRKSGHGIWLHGVEHNARIEEANVTEGCVAFYNEDIVELSQWLLPNQGIVVIAEDASKVNQKNDLETVQRLTQDWYRSWAARKIDPYLKHYSQNFRFGSMRIKQFKAYKKRVFKSYKTMTIDNRDMRVMTHPKYAVSIMNQDFNGDDRFISQGRKILYWKRYEDGSWKIFDEQFEKRRLKPINISQKVSAGLLRVKEEPRKVLGSNL
jgi:murein L,D-transpeptidase YafK